jgi:hypothetical protein
MAARAEKSGKNAVMYRLTEDAVHSEIPLSENATKALEVIRCAGELSLVSAIYQGGVGGNARAGVTKHPIKLTRAVHSGRAHLTVGGAPCFVLPGGGINFMVDVERIKSDAFYWAPTPATIYPIEYTMRAKDYERMGGHMEAMKPF